MQIFHSIPESRLTQEDVVTDGLEIVVDDAVAGAFSLDEIAPALAVEVITVGVCLAVPCHTRTCKPGVVMFMSGVGNVGIWWVIQQWNWISLTIILNVLYYYLSDGNLAKMACQLGRFTCRQ